jgi:hypothetical protein
MVVLATNEVGLRQEMVVRQQDARIVDRRARQSGVDGARQLGLFDPPETSDEGARVRPSVPAQSAEVVSNAPCTHVAEDHQVAPQVKAQSRSTKLKVEAVTVSEADLPSYPPDLSASVDRSISDLPAGQMWFTYRDVQKSFGVSRATVARRMKMKLVPGIRFQNDRIIEDGSVRRFDRLQLRYLLLSLRSSQAL